MTFLSKKYSGGASEVPWVAGLTSFDPEVTNWAASTWDAKYARIGGLLYIQLDGEVTGQPTGAVEFSIPDGLDLPSAYAVVMGEIYYVDTSATRTNGYGKRGSANNKIALMTRRTSGTYQDGVQVNANVPHVWAATDFVRVYILVQSNSRDWSRTLTPRGSTFKGALLSKSANQTLTTAVTTAVTFDGELYDTDGFHDNSTNNERLTIPAGVSIVKLAGNIRYASNTTGSRLLAIRKNGSIFIQGLPYARMHPTVAESFEMNVSTAPVYVSAGDYFELVVSQNSGGDLDVNVSVTDWFSIEVIE